MFEVKGNLWNLPADVIAITTNGMVKKNGECVMGRGCALQAKTAYPGIALTLGDLITRLGNNVHRIPQDRDDRIIFSFPVKENWFDNADLDIIELSCFQLVEEVDKLELELNRRPFVAVPRPGCGNGKLSWDDVRPICKHYFDDRFGVVFK